MNLDNICTVYFGFPSALRGVLENWSIVDKFDNVVDNVMNKHDKYAKRGKYEVTLLCPQYLCIFLCSRNF